MKREKRIVEGLVAIIIPIALTAISGVTEIMVSEMIMVPSALCLLTGKGLN